MTQLSNDKILIEFLGFSPISFIDKVLNIVNVNLYSFVKEFEESLKEEQQHEQETENGCAAIETLMERSIDSKFDKWELYCLKNILCLPKGTNAASLPHYKNLNLQVTPQDHDILDDELAQLRMQRVAEKWKKIQLEKKLAKIQARQSQLDLLTAKLQDAKNVAQESGVYPVDQKVVEIKDMIAQANQMVSAVEERTQATNWTSVPLVGTANNTPFDLAQSVQSEVLYHLNKASLSTASTSAWDATKDYRETTAIGSAKNIESIAAAFH